MGERLNRPEKALVIFVMLIFMLIVGKYGYSDARDGALLAYGSFKSKATEYKIKRPCPPGQIRIDVPGGYLYRENVEPSVWRTIYDTYPKSANGKEIIYGFLDKGSIKTADKQLRDLYAVERFDPVEIKPPITWQEDPYDDRYWRFIFYSLRPTRHLLYAGRETGERVYNEKLIEVTESFLDTGMNEDYSWSDYHAVAFRTMVLVNTWRKLREQNALPVEVSTKMLKALKVHGDFLADVNHYEAQHNHGVNQMAALFLLAANFPDITGAEEWLSVARERLNINLKDLVDQDGVLIENSPYYHFYTLKKYWEIHRYSKLCGVSISKEFDTKIKEMVSYGTFILQPDLEIPLIGASLKGRVGRQDMYKEMADTNPHFLYVLTQGKKGTVPPKLNVHYPTAGQTIMRSGWGKKKDFADQTQIIFDVGPYRTSHSDYDALSFSLFGAGIALMPDSGLFTYQSGPYKSYFHGTRAHNTVVVDGMDQAEGAPVAGQFLEGDGFVSQSAQHNLYKGVTHQRSITLLGKNLVVVVDDLLSDKEHEYEQMFHLFPEAKLKVDGTTITATGKKPEQSATIRQLLPTDITIKSVKGEHSPPDGLCSFEFNKAVPNHSISFAKHAKRTSYITLIEIGRHDESLSADVKAGTGGERVIDIKTGGESYLIKIGKKPRVEKEVKIRNDKPTKELPKWTTVESFRSAYGWKANQPQNRGLVVDDDANGYQGSGSLRLTTPDDGSAVTIMKDLALDLSDKNLALRLKTSNMQASKGLSIELSTGNWRGYVSCDLRNACRQVYENEWMSISLGKGRHRDTAGQWREYGSGFDWSKIDGIRFKAKATQGERVTVNLDKLATIPGQKEESVVICFDDGHATVLNAVEIMDKYGLKGNVAVISERPERNVSGFLTLAQLKKMQNNHGWNIANHSAHHKNAIDEYYSKDNLEGFEKDLLDGVKYLSENGIDSASNWYIYPNGATNAEIKRIVGKYYKFARSVDKHPEVFPFGDPLSVKVFSVESRTKPGEVRNAVMDAIKYKQTLFLVFHRIWSPKSRPVPGSYYGDVEFEAIIKDLVDQGAKVRTLSELDAGNGIPLAQVSIADEVPEQILIDVTIEKKTIFQKSIRAVANYMGNVSLSRKEKAATIKIKDRRFFSDDFSSEGILEEAGKRSESSSLNWWLSSGAFLTVEDGSAKTVHEELPAPSKWRRRYATNNPDETDNGYHPQNIFRLVTQKKWKSFRQEAYFRINKDNLSSSSYRKASNGLFLLNRYLDGDNLYYTGIRVDGAAVIKKKFKGEYYTMAYKPLFGDGIYDRNKNPNLLPKNAWIGLKSEVWNGSDGVVHIQLYVDTGGNGRWTLALEAVDDGSRFGGRPITGKGHAGIRTDFMDVEFDNYKIE